jgi:hypothetical protein
MKHRWIIAALITLLFAHVAGAQANKACGLLTAAELNSVLGGNVAGLSGGSMPGDVQICTGSTPKARVMLRIARAKGDSGAAAAKGLEIAKKMGAQVDVKTFGPITCSSLIPPKDKEVYGFNTTCTVTKGDAVAGVEITAKSQADMVPIEKLHPLAEKMSGRF